MSYLSNTFGIEIECYLPEGGSAVSAAAAITSRLGSPCFAEGYNHTTQPHWKIVTDGSLGDYARGIEVVSPILTGEDGVAALLKVMDALTDYGCTVSRQCGLHVHVGVGSPTIGFFRNILKLYAVYEPVIDAMMPPSRRESRNLYCRSVTSVALEAIDRAAGLDDLLRLLTGRRGTEDRYYKLNLAAYRRHRTVEFRQHSGTLDGTKAKNWLFLCLRMVESAKTELLALSSRAPARINRARRGTKTFLVGELSLRPEGVTVAEAAAVSGWPSIAWTRLAATCGFSFTTQRTGNEVRYFARAAAAAIPAARISLEGLFELLGCETSERDYFRGRTANLSGSIAWAA